MSDEKEMGWKSTFDPKDTFTMLPDGDAFFTVKKLEKSRRAMGKLGECHVADLLLTVTMCEGDQSGELKVALPLHKDMTWKILQFFTAIGQRKHGDEGTFNPKWDKVVGEGGLCVINTREYEGKKGKMKVNDISEFKVAEPSFD